MAFYGYKGDIDNCYWTPHGATYDSSFVPTPIQASSPYEFGEPELIRYKSSAYYTDDSFVTPSELNYSVYNYSEPKLLHHEPIEYHSSYNYYEYCVNPSVVNYSETKLLQYEPPRYDQCCCFPSETKFTISYSTVEFNESEFEEYDPTPYGGGYDPSKTYGNPLPPSDIICYPRSLPQSDSMPPDNFSYASIPSPYGKDDDLPKKPPKIDTKTQPSNVENGDKVASEGADVKPSEVIPGDDSPSCEHKSGFENGIRGDYGYEGEGQVTHYPYGSGLETLDLCESIFGYWPCLAERERSKYPEVCDRHQRMDPWESATNYLFGSPVVYD